MKNHYKRRYEAFIEYACSRFFEAETQYINGKEMKAPISYGFGKAEDLEGNFEIWLMDKKMEEEERFKKKTK